MSDLDPIIEDLIFSARSLLKDGRFPGRDAQMRNLARAVLSTLIGPHTASLRSEIVDLAVKRRATRCAKYVHCAAGEHSSQCPLDAIEQDMTALVDALKIAEADEGSTE